MDPKIYVVVGGQFGSEGKGAVAGRLCHDLEAQDVQVTGVRVGGPNAGHTVLGQCPKGCDGGHDQPVRIGGPDMLVPPGGDAHPWRLRQVPVAAVTAPSSQLVIAQGSEIDPGVLRQEIRDLDAAGYSVSDRLWVDSQATLMDPMHAAAEKDVGLSDLIGSTSKGIGSARSERVWRRAGLARSIPTEDRMWRTTDTADKMRLDLRPNLTRGHAVVIEGTQGYGLGLHAGYYPFCTSGDCRAIDFLAQAGLSPWQISPNDLRVLVCLRPHPIRVAGNSGPLEGETTWEDLGLPVEYTTVTQKVRRVGMWDPALARDALYANGFSNRYGRGSVRVALTMADSISPQIAGMNAVVQDIWPVLGSQEGEPIRDLLIELGVMPSYVGTGPDTAVVESELYPMTKADIVGAAGVDMDPTGPVHPGPAPESLLPPRTTQVDTRPEGPFTEWVKLWMSRNCPAAEAKAVEYGSNSLAAMGRMLSDAQGRPVSQPEALELGCTVYLNGKVQRLVDAMQHGRLPSSDTWDDVAVYALMAMYIREHGQWP